MNSWTIPKGLEALVIDGKKVDWGIPPLLFCPCTDDKNILEQLTYRFLYRGAEDSDLRPFKTPKVEHPLAFIFAGQLALRDVADRQLDDPWNIAKYFASENAVTMPPYCDDAILRYRSRFEEANYMLDRWTAHGNLSVEEVGKKFEEAVLPPGEIQLTRVRIPQAIALFNAFLDGKRYNPHIQGGYAPFLPHFDSIRRLMRDSMQDTWLNSENAINRLRTEFYAKPGLARARLMDIFTLYHVRLADLMIADSVKEQEITGYYRNVRQVYMDLIDMAYKSEVKISAYTSLIAYDLLIGDGMAKDHYEMLNSSYPGHPKTTLVRKLTDGTAEDELWDHTDKLRLVGLADHYHPGLTDIMLDRLNAYRSDHPGGSPFPHHIMNQLLDHTQSTKMISMKRRRRKGQTYVTMEFSQPSYIRFQNEVEVSDDRKRIVIRPDERLLERMFGVGTMRRLYRSLKNRITRQQLGAIYAKTCVDSHLFHPPLVMYNTFTTGSNMFTR